MPSKNKTPRINDFIVSKICIDKIFSILNIFSLHRFQMKKEITGGDQPPHPDEGTRSQMIR